MTWLPCPHCGDDATYRDQPSGPVQCAGCGLRQAVARVEGGNVVIDAPRVGRRSDLGPPPTNPDPRGPRPRGRRARRAWTTAREAGR